MKSDVGLISQGSYLQKPVHQVKRGTGSPDTSSSKPTVLAKTHLPPNQQYCIVWLWPILRNRYPQRVNSTSNWEKLIQISLLSFLKGFVIHLVLSIFSQMISIDSPFQLSSRKQKYKRPSLCNLRIYCPDVVREECITRK
jgi:hypothetical protein